MKILKWLKSHYKNGMTSYYIYNENLSLYLLQNFSGMTNTKEDAGVFNEITAIDFIHLCHRENLYEFVLINKDADKMGDLKTKQCSTRGTRSMRGS